MIVTILTWAVIAASAYVSGAFLLSFSSCDRVHTADLTIAAGLAFLTVYAQIFSLFYHVGALAFLTLAVLCLVFLVLLRKKGVRILRLLPMADASRTSWKWIFVVLTVFAFAFWTAKTPSAYDTSLYHAQAIRWIEEYGVVPGLGNLHNRFAYNSSFLCLQALFSFRWLLGQSLHSVNGFIAVLAVCYAVLTQSFRKEALFSDFLKLSALAYLYEQRDDISSPNTDLMALLMVWYVLVKWTELAEQKEERTTPWCVLCILSAFTMTLKLSSALLVLLTVYPLVLLIRHHEGKKLVLSLLSGIVCLVPWMARSVILSGYLIYPVSGLDLFDVDWKMSPSVLSYDSMEISVWGRSVKDVSRYHEPLPSWVRVWFFAQTTTHKVLIVLAAASFVLCLVSILTGLIRKTMSPAMAVGLAVMLSCTLMWFFSAPDTRYGKIYLFLLISWLLYRCLARFGQTVIPLIGVPLIAVLLGAVLVHDEGILVQEADYPSWAVQGVSWNNQTVYLPTGGDQAGYEYFPSTPYGQLLEQIELRGDDLSCGFRVKEEYRMEHRNAYGNVW